MYFVYLLPLFLIVLVALAIFAPPLLAVVVFAAALVGLGAFKFLGRGTDPEHAPPPNRTTSPGAGAASTAGTASEEDTGLWGERWPEQRAGEEPSP